MKTLTLAISLTIMFSVFLCATESKNYCNTFIRAGSCPCSKCKANQGKDCTFPVIKCSSCEAFDYYNSNNGEIPESHGVPSDRLDEGHPCIYPGEDNCVEVDADGKGLGCVGPVIGGKDCSYEQNGRSFDCTQEVDSFVCTSLSEDFDVYVYYLKKDDGTWVRLTKSEAMTEDEKNSLLKIYNDVEFDVMISYKKWSCGANDESAGKVSASAPNCNTK